MLCVSDPSRDGLCKGVSQYYSMNMGVLYSLKYGHSAPLLWFWFSLSPFPSTNTSQTEGPGLACEK